MNKKVAIPIDEKGVLESHFGHTPLFAFYSIKENKIESKETLIPPPHAPGVLPKWLNSNGVTDVLAGTMGERAHKILTHFDVNVFLGSPVIEADELIQGFMNDTIEFNAELCQHNHEHHEHHEHNHQHNHSYHNGYHYKANDGSTD